MKTVIEMAREAGLIFHALGNTPAELERFAALVAAAEREACAKVCESQPMRQDIDVRDQCATAIRERGITQASTSPHTPATSPPAQA